MYTKDSIPKEIYEIHASICQCLANPKRLEILNTLRDKELSATEIADKIGISSANASQHLAIMRNKGILKSRREGVSIHYSLANPKVITACDIMREVLFEYLNEKQSLTKKVKF
ncbi:MAG: winged helix-turn-helix transcriptional regulator [Deltaproteobacteria bacterium]|nr:winged helix-turn-helix transcriptional regulator [Deltaproteobacteria bacterium]